MAATDVTVEQVNWSAYRIPTDAPEADGTLQWDATTMILVEVSAAGEAGTGWTYAERAAGELIGNTLADVVTGRCALDVPLHTSRWTGGSGTSAAPV